MNEGRLGLERIRQPYRLAGEQLTRNGYLYTKGLAITPGRRNINRRDNERDVILKEDLKNAISRLNPHVPLETVSGAVDRVVHASSHSLSDVIAVNEYVHKLLLDGVPVEYRESAQTKKEFLRLVDFDNPENNDFLMVNDFPVIHGYREIRLDVVLFLNGIPLVVIVFPEPGNEMEPRGLKPVYKRLQNFMEAVPSMFYYNFLCIISDGVTAAVGSFSAGYSRFIPWRSMDGMGMMPDSVNLLRCLMEGLFYTDTFLDLLRNFTVFEKTKRPLFRGRRMTLHIEKKIAACHQYYAANAAIAATVRAVSVSGDQRCGVVWHTQGSGKSMTMLFYAAKLMRTKELENPTILVLTDRNDLEDQLFETFASAVQLLPQAPLQVENRRQLQQLLKKGAGRIFFTTVQKFFPGRGRRYPQLSARRNIIVIADEAHRSQYDFVDGFARHMRDALPNASFIGFTGTPLHKDDKNTRAVFGDYIDVYDIHHAVRDGVTVDVFYESRLADIHLNEEERASVDREFEAITRSLNLGKEKQLQRKWAKLEAILGSRERLQKISAHLVSHFGLRQEVFPGKAMVVAVSRQVCIDLYNEIIGIMPQWHSDDDDKGVIKTVITGSPYDPPEWSMHIRDKAGRRFIGNRLKNPFDSLKIVIVCDMWLTGFDAPCLHTLYVDKPLKDHLLMQAITRVNRVYQDKPGGLVVDYLGIAESLQEAITGYFEGRGEAATFHRQEDAVVVMEEKYAEIKMLLKGCDCKLYLDDYEGESEQHPDFMSILEYILGLKDGKNLFIRLVTQCKHAFMLAVPHPVALRLKDEIGFLQAVVKKLSLFSFISYVGSEGGEVIVNDEIIPGTFDGKCGDQVIAAAVRQIVSKVVTEEEMTGIFGFDGMERPRISLFSDELLENIRRMKQGRVAEALLAALLKREIRIRSRWNVLQGRSFWKSLNRLIQQYHEKVLSEREVIEAYIGLVSKLKELDRREGELGLSIEELAVYDLLQKIGNRCGAGQRELLKKICRQLVRRVRENTSIDWKVRESVRARLRVAVKRTLRVHGYSLKDNRKMLKLLMKQMELFVESWLAADKKNVNTSGLNQHFQGDNG